MSGSLTCPHVTSEHLRAAYAPHVTSALPDFLLRVQDRPCRASAERPRIDGAFRLSGGCPGGPVVPPWSFESALAEAFDSHDRAMSDPVRKDHVVHPSAVSALLAIARSGRPASTHGGSSARGPDRWTVGLSRSLRSIAPLDAFSIALGHLAEKVLHPAWSRDPILDDQIQALALAVFNHPSNTISSGWTAWFPTTRTEPRA
jgi:hypothetical protein